MEQPMKDVAILGAGGGSKSIFWLVETVNEISKDWSIVGFIDDDRKRHGTLHCGLPVLGGFEWFERRRAHLVQGVGSPDLRRLFAARARERGLEFLSPVAPDVRYSRFVTIGEGTVICSGSVLTSHIRVGSHCLINMHCTVGHDNEIGDYCTLAPGVHLSGASRLEEGVEIGAGAVILPGKRVGRNAIIGAGAVVTTDIPCDSVAAGVPARVIRKRMAA
jgi:sugar O-acyltransferase (sialic acid O-acetyltransferase NeuD family)